MHREISSFDVRAWHLSPAEIKALEFIALADGEGLVLAQDIAIEVGWSPRAAGAKLRSLHLRGYVNYRAVPGARINGWELTETGRAIAWTERGPQRETSKPWGWKVTIHLYGTWSPGQDPPPSEAINEAATRAGEYIGADDFVGADFVKVQEPPLDSGLRRKGAQVA